MSEEEEEDNDEFEVSLEDFDKKEHIERKHKSI
jgi:hypothetical protein